MNGTIDPRVDYVAGLAASVGRNWPTIAAAKDSANQVRELLSERLTARFGAFSSGDVDVIAFGSLARQEWTSGSDVDWTLLIDGGATPDHRVLARDIREAISGTQYQGKSLPLPGAEGIFGTMAFSHDIIHHIGGQADTNRNTTQRVLLLLEAFPIRSHGSEDDVRPFERVTRNILFRYLHDDTNFFSGGEAQSRIPRFLLNDIVRYWRTMCVDFAYKEWEQAGGKWAVRNIKLRMSRKLLFVSALLTVFSCYKNDALKIEPGDRTRYVPVMQEHLMRFVQTTPLNIVGWALQSIGHAQLAGRMLDSYEQFLSKLNDGAVRERLGNVPPANIYHDQEFLEIREISHQFQTALTEAFFQADNDLREFTTTYGVF